MNRFTDKTILITGGTSGMGLATAVSSEPTSCRRRPELSSNCTKLVLRISVRDSHPGAAIPVRV
ncbi:hypothetical protein ACWGH3_38695 [Streptomyces sp. NPDC054884]